MIITNETVWVNRMIAMIARVNRLRVIPVWALVDDRIFTLTLACGARSATTNLSIGDVRSALGGNESSQATIARTITELFGRVAA
jgi:hypothetical protein